MNTNQAKLTIFVYSDYICPYCFIGKLRVEQILHDFNVEIEWKMIEIHPETPENGLAIESLSNPYLPNIWTNIKALASESGIEINFPKYLANSRLAIIASEYARKKGKFSEFHEALFNEYWIKGKNISKVDIILNLGEKLKFNTDELSKFLYSTEGEELLNFNLESSLDDVVTGVPAFVINGKVVTGAQPYNLIKKVIEKELNLCS